MKNNPIIESNCVLQNHDLILTPENEESMEIAISKALDLLIKYKERKMHGGRSNDPNDASLLDLLKKTNEKISTGKDKRKTLQIPQAIHWMYLSHKIQHSHPSVFILEDYERDSSSLKNELINLAEHWIQHIKSLFPKLNTSFKDFEDEKRFWKNLGDDLETIQNLSMSDEYRFIIEMLKNYGKLALVYTLNILVTDQRAYNLCMKFNKAYKDIDFSFLKEHSDNNIEEISPDQYIGLFSKNNTFASNALRCIKTLRNMKHQPRIIRRSICNNLASLRNRIIYESLRYFHPSFYDVFLEFSELSAYLNNENMKDHEDSRITIRSLIPLDEYTNTLYRISKGTEAILLSEDLIDDQMKSKLCSLLQNEIVSFKNDVASKEGMPERVKANVSSQQLLVSETFLNLLSVKADHFMSFDPISMTELIYHFESIGSFIDFQYFKDKIRLYTENTVKRIQLKTDSLNNIDGCIQIAEMLLIFYRLKPFFKPIIPIDELEMQVESNKKVFYKMVDSLPFDILDRYIFDRHIMKYHSEEENSDVGISQIVMNEIDELRYEQQLNKIAEILSFDERPFDGISNLIRKLVVDIQFVGHRFKLIKMIFEKYKNTIEKYGRFFYNQDLEDILKDLVGFKWRYLNEEVMLLIESGYQTFIQKLSNFESKFESINSRIITEFIDCGKKINVHTIADLFENTEKALVLGILQTDKDKFLSIFRHIISKDKYDVAIDQMNVDDFTADKILDFFCSKYNIEFEIQHRNTICAEIEREVETAKEAILNYELIESENINDNKIIDGVEKIDYCIRLDKHRKSVSTNDLEFIQLSLSREADEYFFDLVNKVEDMIVDCVYSSVQTFMNIMKNFSKASSYIDKLKYHKLFVGSVSYTLNLLPKIEKICQIDVYSWPKIKKIGDEIDLTAFKNQPLSNTKSGMIKLATKYASSEIEDIESVVDSILNLKIQKYLSEEDFSMLKTHRSNLESEIENMKKTFNCFPGEEAVFLANLNQFEIRLNIMREEIGVFNQLFSIYKLPSLLIDLKPGILKEEYDLFKAKNEYVGTIMSIKLKDISGDLGEVKDCLDRAFNTALMQHFCKKISKLEKPLSYLKEITLFCSQKYINLTQTLQEYVDSFDEVLIRDLIEKSKIDSEISKFILKNRCKVLDSIKTTSNGKNIFIDNFEDINEMLQSQRTNLDLVVKFNRFNMYTNELGEIGDYIEEQEVIFSSLKNTQESIMDLGSIISKESMDIYQLQYRDAKTDFEDLLANSVEMSEKTVLSRLSKIQKNTDDINRGIYSSLDSMRSRCNRLYFVPNSELIRSIHTSTCIASLIASIFNIANLVIENEMIVAIVGKTGSQEEIVKLDVSVKLDAPIDEIINKFDASLKSTLKNTFLKKVYGSDTQKIDIIEELVSEFKYFNNKSIEASYRIERLYEYSKKFPDILKIFPRLKLTDTQADSIEKLAVYMNDTPYLFEYYPPTDFIFTFLTAKIFASISLSKNMCGVILYGPSGTGKTESVKYYCRTIGRPLFVFCCNENCDFSSLKNIIIGCALTGSYICFDEFNRLKKDVMSSVTELIFEKRSEIKVFLTMNLGYVGRYELPKTLKSIFGEILVDNQDIKDIIYYYTKSYKLYDLIRNLKSECSQNTCYDFGLRAVRSIFDMSLNNSEDTKEYGSEDQYIFIRNAVFFFMSTLQDSDKNILIQNIKNIFGLKLSELNLNLSLESIFKKALSFKNGVIVFGGCGKSSLIKTVAIDKLNGWVNSGKVYRYNPLNLMCYNDSIFGSIDGTTKEWKDSVFLKDLRASLNDITEKWFIFDGPIRSTWIEDFNSILDDNRQLCLVSGERIRIPPSFKFIFETDSIEEATPATLTRVFLINTGYNSTVESTSNESELSIENDFLFDNQKKALGRLTDYLKSQRVIFLIGKEGFGKKTIFRSLNIDSEVLYELNPSKPYVYLDNFEKSSVELQEQIREFWEHGEIGNISIPNLRIVCGVNVDVESFDSLPITQRLFGVSKVILENEVDIDKFVKNNTLIGNNLIEAATEFLKFVYNSYGTLGRYDFINMRSMTHFIKLLDSSYVETGVVDIPNYLYFIFELIFDQLTCRDKKIAKRFLETYLGTAVSDVEFHPNNTFKILEDKSDCHESNGRLNCFLKQKSFLRYLLVKRYDIVIKGPRLCGKRHLLKKCLDEIGSISDVEVYEWNNPDEISKLRNGLENGRIYVFILVEDNKMPEFNIDMKFLEQHTVCISLGSVPVSIDIHKLISNEPLERVITNAKTSDYRSSASVESTMMVSVEDSFEHLLDRCKDQSPRFCRFDNFFKLVCFYHLFKHVKERYSAEFEMRRKFLKNGVIRIKEFSDRITELKESIGNERIVLKEKQDQLENFIVLLDKERSQCREDQDNLEIKQKEIAEEMMMLNEKKEAVEYKLEQMNKILDESKRNISLLTKAHLSEIKSMTNPPDTVRKTIEFTYAMIENTSKIPEWGFLQGYIKKDDFIVKVLRVEDCSAESCKYIKSNFIERYSQEKISNASRACELLYQWMNSIIVKRETLSEILPMRNEVENLEEDLNAKKIEMDAKMSKLSSVIERIDAITESKCKSEADISRIEGNVSKLKRDLVTLEEITKRLRYESEEWRYVEFDNILENPTGFIENHKDVLLKYCKEIFVDKHTIGCDEFSDIKKGCVEISLDEKGFEKAISNAMYYKSDLIIRNVDRFDVKIYDLIKNQMNRYDGFFDVDDASKKYGKVILQGNVNNFFKDETFRLDFKEKFKVSRVSTLESSENELLNLLNADKLDLDSILDQQKIICDERERLKKEQATRAYYGRLNRVYDSISTISIHEYNHPISLNVFKAFVEKNQDNCNDVFRLIDDFIAHSFRKKLLRDEQDRYILADELENTIFNMSEISQYGFDYTFVSDFDDVIFEVKNIVRIDYEISAGSRENNQIIAELLKEESNKVILVKNIHFLPLVLKTGTNRFVFTIEKNHYHPLIGETRIVFVDRDVSHGRILQNLVSVFGEDVCKRFKDLMKVYSVGLELKFNFCLRDVKICIDNGELDKDFLVEIVYFSKLTDSERVLIQEKLSKL